MLQIKNLPLYRAANERRWCHRRRRRRLGRGRRRWRGGCRWRRRRRCCFALWININTSFRNYGSYISFTDCHVIQKSFINIGWPIWSRQLFVDIKFKVPSQYKLLILKRNSQFEVNKRLSATRWATLYIRWNDQDFVEAVMVQDEVDLHLPPSNVSQ